MTRNIESASPNPFDIQPNDQNAFTNPFGKAGFGFDDEFDQIQKQELPQDDNQQQGSVFAKVDKNDNLFGSFCS